MVTSLWVTMRVIVLVPKGQVTVGAAPLAVPQLPTQSKVRGQPMGSEEPVPSRVVLAPLGLVPVTVWSGPALVVGTV